MIMEGERTRPIEIQMTNRPTGIPIEMIMGVEETMEAEVMVVDREEDLEASANQEVQEEEVQGVEAEVQEDIAPHTIFLE